MGFDAIIIGGGAAGLFCAAMAGKRGRRILVIERNAQAGRKILISGGGRCNFTNLDVTSENFVSQNPHFAKSALARYTPKDFIELIKKHKIAFYEKKLGQLFCRETSRQIVDMLLAECRDGRVKILTSCSVESVESGGKNFAVRTDQGTFESERLIVATGGLSFAKVGATDLGYKIAKQFGLKMVQTRPSLVPLVLEGEGFSELAGVSVDSRISSDAVSFRENILFTHRGLSGPAILQISNYWRRDRPVTIDLLPDIDARELLTTNKESRKRIDNLLADRIPAKAANVLFKRDGGPMPVASYSPKQIEATAERLNNWTVKFKETEGYDRAEVTLGGVSTDELSSRSMEAKKVPGLYFIGEVVDVTGWLGGYNFQWAWASGHAAAESI